MPLADIVRQQFRGRKKVWTAAFVLSSIVVGASLLVFRPTCDLIFQPRIVAKNYALFWLVMFLLIGLTKRGKVVLVVATLLVSVVTTDLIRPRITANEHSAVWRLQELGSMLKTGKEPSQSIREVWGANTQGSGYVLEVKSEPSQDGALPHYVLDARPVCYCRDGQRSFVLDVQGAIHFTNQDRAASIRDPEI